MSVPVDSAVQHLNPLFNQLAKMRVEHRELDSRIQDLVNGGPLHQFEVQRLKRQKLQLKDRILSLESALVPDIIA